MQSNARPSSARSDSRASTALSTLSTHHQQKQMPETRQGACTSIERGERFRFSATRDRIDASVACRMEFWTEKEVGTVVDLN